MKLLKKSYKYLFGFIIGIVLVGSISVYAVETIIDSSDVTYNNKNSSAKNVQESIDELYQKYKDFTGEQDTKYTEEILHGADPVLGNEMIPVNIDAKGVVKYANVNTPWYSYEEKRWANAVILESGKTHQVGDTIPENEIAAYFVWIPRYKYKLWNVGEEQKLYNLEDLTDEAGKAENDPTSLRHITGNAKLIDIVFESKSTDPSIEIADGKYYTHPAFTSFDVNGLWVGKFEISGSTDAVKVKPNVTSWRGATVGTFWRALYNYNRGLDSHMMKNTEWGATAYLSHSVYGIGNEINVNNNSNYLTGYSAAANTDQSSYPGQSGTAETITKPYNTATGYLASTTGNITGIYDMSGGAQEYMAAYREGQAVTSSELNSELTDHPNYFDKYEETTSAFDYSKRIIGDATAEMGPFYYYYDKDKTKRAHNTWYADNSDFVDSTLPWFGRGGNNIDGAVAGQFDFHRHIDGVFHYMSTRLVLAVKGS